MSLYAPLETPKLELQLTIIKSNPKKIIFFIINQFNFAPTPVLNWLFGLFPIYLIIILNNTELVQFLLPLSRFGFKLFLYFKI